MPSVRKTNPNAASGLRIFASAGVPRMRTTSATASGYPTAGAPLTLLLQTNGKCARFGITRGVQAHHVERSRTAAAIITGACPYVSGAIGWTVAAPRSRDTARAMSQENVKIVGGALPAVHGYGSRNGTRWMVTP